MLFAWRWLQSLRDTWRPEGRIREDCHTEDAVEQALGEGGNPAVVAYTWPANAASMAHRRSSYVVAGRLEAEEGSGEEDHGDQAEDYLQHHRWSWVGAAEEVRSLRQDLVSQ